MSNITDEYVTKRQVLDALENLPWYIEDDFFSAIDRAARTITSIPGTPSPQDRRASWVRTTGMYPPEFHGKKQCSLCRGFALCYRIGREELSQYCPHCGARMENADGTQTD